MGPMWTAPPIHFGLATPQWLKSSSTRRGRADPRRRHWLPFRVHPRPERLTTCSVSTWYWPTAGLVSASGQRARRFVLGGARRRRQLRASSPRSSSSCTRSAPSTAAPCSGRLEQRPTCCAFWRDFILSAPRTSRLVRVGHRAARAAVSGAVHMQKMCAIVWCYTGPLAQGEERLKPIRTFRRDDRLPGPIPWPASPEHVPTRNLPARLAVVLEGTSSTS